MPNKLFVGGLPWSTDSNALKEAFSVHGDVAEAKVVVDRETGRSRGFGFVTFTHPEDAQKALALNGTELGGRKIRVDFAQENNDRGGRGPRRD